MNKEEIEELKDFTIDITDIDELALGLEVCSKKSNMVIQEFANTIIQLQQENKKQKEVIDRKKYLLKEQGAELKELYSEIDKLQGGIDKAIEYLEEPNRDSFDYSKAKLLDILNEVSK